MTLLSSSVAKKGVASKSTSKLHSINGTARGPTTISGRLKSNPNAISSSVVKDRNKTTSLISPTRSKLLSANSSSNTQSLAAGKKGNSKTVQGVSPRNSDIQNSSNILSRKALQEINTVLLSRGKSVAESPKKKDVKKITGLKQGLLNSKLSSTAANEIVKIIDETSPPKKVKKKSKLKNSKDLFDLSETNSSNPLLQLHSIGYAPKHDSFYSALASPIEPTHINHLSEEAQNLSTAKYVRQALATWAKAQTNLRTVVSVGSSVTDMTFGGTSKPDSELLDTVLKKSANQIQRESEPLLDSPVPNIQAYIADFPSEKRLKKFRKRRKKSIGREGANSKSSTSMESNLDAYRELNMVTVPFVGEDCNGNPNRDNFKSKHVAKQSSAINLKTFTDMSVGSNRIVYLLAESQTDPFPVPKLLHEMGSSATETMASISTSSTSLLQALSMTNSIACATSRSSSPVREVRVDSEGLLLKSGRSFDKTMSSVPSSASDMSESGVPEMLRSCERTQHELAAKRSGEFTPQNASWSPDVVTAISENSEMVSDSARSTSATLESLAESLYLEAFKDLITRKDVSESEGSAATSSTFVTEGTASGLNVSSSDGQRNVDIQNVGVNRVASIKPPDLSWLPELDDSDPPKDENNLKVIHEQHGSCQTSASLTSVEEEEGPEVIEGLTEASLLKFSEDMIHTLNELEISSNMNRVSDSVCTTFRAVTEMISDLVAHSTSSSERREQMTVTDVDQGTTCNTVTTQDFNSNDLNNNEAESSQENHPATSSNTRPIKTVRF